MGVYIRHRDRMVQQSVYQDLRNTLIACRWMKGTTSQPVYNPSTPRVFNETTGLYTLPIPEVITTTELIPLAEGHPISLIDYFPEADGQRSRDQKTPKNTFAMDSGQASDPDFAELGSNRQEQQYIFNLAFYAVSDAVALAVMNDLRDRYNGRIVASDGIDLYDWVSNPSTPAVRMDVDGFRYARNDDANLVPNEVHLYFAELLLTDYVDA